MKTWLKITLELALLFSMAGSFYLMILCLSVMAG
jgi:hypothetical protein